MNREEAKGIIEHFEIVKAYAEGKTIQKYRSQFSRSHGKYVSGWEDTDSPQFFKGARYRIKPEPRKIRMWLDKDGEIVARRHSWLDPEGGEPSEHYKSYSYLVEFVEVLPEDKS